MLVMHPKIVLNRHSLRGATTFPPRSDIILSTERQSSLRGENVSFDSRRYIIIVHPHDN